MDGSGSSAGLGYSFLRDGKAEKVDIGKWLPDPTESSALSLGGTLFATILNYLVLLGRCQLSHSDELSHKYRREAERLFLWGHGVSAGDGHLDGILSRSQDLRLSVITILSGLATCVTSGSARLISQGSKADVVPAGINDAANELQRLTDQAATLLRPARTTKEEESEDEVTWDSESESASSIFEFEDFLDDIKTYIDCLTDLSEVLQSPTDDTDPTFDTEPEYPLEDFKVSSLQALVFCRKIRDRFPNLDKWLVERLGEGNAHRASLLLREKEGSKHADEGDPECTDAERSEYIADTGERWSAEDSESDRQPGSLSLEAFPGATETTGSTLETRSIFSKPTKDKPQTQGQDTILPISFDVAEESLSDGEDHGTVASFSTTASDIEGGRVRVPPMPAEVHQGTSFHCFICDQDVSLKSKTRREWK